MDVLKILVVVVVGAVLGIVASLLLFSTEDWAEIPPIRTAPPVPVLCVGSLIGAIAGGHLAYRLFWHGRKTERHAHLTSEAEKNARAKFMPSSDTAADDPSIHHDKRNVKPGDR